MIELPNKRIRSLKKKKQMKGAKGETKIYSIQAEIIKKDYIIVSLKWKKIKMPSKLFSINDKVKVTYDCIIKVT